MARYRVNLAKGVVVRALEAMGAGGTIDIDYGDLAVGRSFSKIGSLQLRVASVQEDTRGGRQLTCTDQHRRTIVVTYYKRYHSAYVDLPR